MSQRRPVVAAWAVRMVRGLWPDRNPLRRTVDRVEAVVAAGLAAAFVAGVPLAAVAAGHYAHSYASRAAAQRAAWHQVPATLLTTVPASAYGDQATVRASWTAPDGRRRTGMVPAPPVAPAGGTVLVWVDEAGRLAGTPSLQPSQARGQAVAAAILAPVVLGMIVLCAGQLAHAALDRRRLAA